MAGDIMPSRIRLIIVSLLATLVLAGCTLQLAYTNLDRLVLRWINDQVELSAEQSQRLREALNDNLDWHCQSHLPQYVAFLSDIRTDIELGQLDRTQIDHYSAQISQFGEEIVAVSVPLATELLASLDDEQVRALQQSFDESNQRLIERLSQPDPIDQQRERFERMERRLNRFIGRLTKEQQLSIQRWADRYQRTDGHQLAYAYQWQAQLTEALAIRNTDAAQFSQKIKILFDPGSGWDEAYRQVVEWNQQLTLQMMLDVLEQSTDRQQRRMFGKIERYAEDFDALSCTAPGLT